MYYNSLVNSLVIYKPLWIDFVERNREAFSNPSAPDPFNGWDRDMMPESTAEIRLIMALELLYADAPDMAQPYLRLSLEVAERTLAEDKCRSERCRADYPHNLGKVLRAKCYAEALLSGQLELPTIEQAIPCFQEYLKGETSSDWKTSLTQADLLALIRLELVSRKASAAAALLKSNRKRLNWHSEQARILALVADETDRRPMEVKLGEFDQFFDVCRNPKYTRQLDGEGVIEERDIQRFELGIIRHTYLISAGGSADHQAILQSISR